VVLINWYDRYNVGIASIDAQHRELAGILNALAASVVDGATTDSTRAILTELVHFTDAHFAHEQNLFRQANYPAANLHTRRHGFLRLILKRGCEALERNRGTVVAGGQLEFLRGWLMDHINRDDRAFADYLREKAAMLPPVPMSCA
jgi:hemerythrin